MTSIIGKSSPIRDGATPLHVAAASLKNSAQTTKLLLQLGAKPTTINDRSSNFPNDLKMGRGVLLTKFQELEILC